MSSSRRLIANRANARRSTGPRSAEGKAQSRLNAFKHGLATPPSAIPALAPAIAALTHRLVGDNESDPALWSAATRVAEAAVDVMRARWARTALFDQMIQSPNFLQVIPAAESMPAHLPHYKSSSIEMRIQAIMNGTRDKLARSDWTRLKQYLDYAAEAQRVRHHNEAVKQTATQYRSDWDQLDKLDRYERRALSRRRTAIRALEKAQAAAQSDRGREAERAVVSFNDVQS